MATNPNSFQSLVPAPGIMSVASPSGTVVFIGAGPGAADLLTLRAVDRLRRADVIVHDRLVHPQLLATLPPATERICIDRGDLNDPDPGGTTGELLLRLAAEGRFVVRLKGGDPTVFARLTEELAPLRQAGVAVEIVPGVTAAVAAAAAAGMPLTSREAASSVTLITGRSARGKAEPIDLRPWAMLPGTLALYMGVEQIGEWSRQLMAAGRPRNTPVTLVSRCSWPDQQVATTTLDACAAEAGRQGWRSPAVVFVGGTAASAGVGPLTGSLVVVTRPLGQEAEIAALVRAAGGAVLHVPVIRITPPADPGPLAAVASRLGSYDWVVFASANGVRGVLESLRSAGLDGRGFGTARLAAIGPATRRSLEEAGYCCDLVPGDYSSEGLVESFAGLPAGGRFLLVRAERGRDLLRRSLEAAGHHVEEVAAYASVAVNAIDRETTQLLSAAPAPWVTVTSGAIAEAVIRLCSPWIRGWRIASISPVTSAAVRRFGLEPTVEAMEATAAGLVAAIVRQETAQADESAGSVAAIGSSAPLGS